MSAAFPGRRATSMASSTCEWGRSTWWVRGGRNLETRTTGEMSYIYALRRAIANFYEVVIITIIIYFTAALEYYPSAFSI